jgi:Fic family protein
LKSSVVCDLFTVALLIRGEDFTGLVRRLCGEKNRIHRKNAVNISDIHRIKLSTMLKYIHECPTWPDFSWQGKEINGIFGKVRMMQGLIAGQMEALGFMEREESTLINLTRDVVKSSEIEGEILNYDQVRSSIARRLGIQTGGMVPSPQVVEGVVEMMLDATQQYQQPMTEERLLGWHALLFPTGYSGPYKITVGRYRTGVMQIVSGAIGQEKVHFQAVPPEDVKREMDAFLEWFNTEDAMDPVLKAAIAHFRFIIIHPFEDGNGRIARALTDLLIARSEQGRFRYYSMSDQIMAERKQYYEVLQRVQHSTGDITLWLEWFLNCLYHAMQSTEKTTQTILRRASFWARHAQTEINERQRLMISKLLDDFEGKLRTSKWARMTKTSTDTALRDIKDLMDKGILMQTGEGGRSASYVLKEDASFGEIED